MFRVEVPRLEPGSGTLHDLSEEWNTAVARAERAMTAGTIVAAVGEAGSGRATLLAQAARHTYPRDRILSASAPAPTDVQTWLGLWAPELNAVVSWPAEEWGRDPAASPRCAPAYMTCTSASGT